jgi:hypothetical protein
MLLGPETKMIRAAAWTRKFETTPSTPSQPRAPIQQTLRAPRHSHIQAPPNPPSRCEMRANQHSGVLLRPA